MRSTETGVCPTKGLLRLGLYVVAFLSAMPVDGLRLLNMTTPLVADTREDITLSCSFDMESEELFAVKWYKDDHEFFRYQPQHQPNLRTFTLAGVQVIVSASDCSEDHCNIKLTRLLKHHSDGAYRCEVSTEGPQFRLAAATHNITVATLPKQAPRITGIEEIYNDGANLTATCTSYPSDPIATLSWYIGNQQVPSSFVETSSFDSEGLNCRVITLRYQITKKLAVGEGGTVELKCVSRLPGLPLQPQETTRTVTLRPNRSQASKTQNLHWLDSAGPVIISPSNLLLLMVTAIVTKG